jgi:hypothetical protein
MKLAIILTCFHLHNTHALHLLIRKRMTHVRLRIKRLEIVFAALKYAIMLTLKLDLNCSLLH